MELSAADSNFTRLPRDQARASAESRPASLHLRKAGLIAAMGLLFGVGIFMRVYPSSGYPTLGTDEFGYAIFVKEIRRAGLCNYDAVMRVYLERQYGLREALVPATRVSFLVPAAVIADVFHLPAISALRAISAGSGILLLLLCACMAYRFGGVTMMVGVTALLASSPLLIYLCQRAMIDGFFAFWVIAVLWLFWENLQRPRHGGLLLAYALCLLILILTKETAAFVVFAICGMIASNRILRSGTVTVPLMLATAVPPVIAVLFLSAMMGGIGEFIRFFAMFAAKSHGNFYSVAAQDGPWYRYAVDFLLISPAVVILACGRIFQLRRTDRFEVFIAVFALFTVTGLSCLQYGMSLRYVAFCELPLAWLAFGQVQSLSRRSARVRPAILSASLLLVVSAIGLNQYERIFVSGGCYDPITSAMIAKLRMEKSSAAVKAALNWPY